MSARTDLVVRTALVVLTVLLVLGVAWLLVQITDILLIVLVAAILAAGLSPVVNRLEAVQWTPRGWRLSRASAILVVFLAVVVLLLGVGAILVTPLVLETREFVANFPARLAELQVRARDLQARYPWLPDMAGPLERLPRELATLGRFFRPAAGVAFRVLGGVASVVTVLFLAFYMLVEGPAIRAGVLALFPRRERAAVADVLDQIGARFGGWLRGQLLLGLVIGAAAWAWTSIVGLPYPVLLGLIAGITELVPMVGPVLGAIPAVFLALFQSPVKVLLVVAGYAVIQQAEANFIVPRVMRRAVGLSPLLTILALVVGGKLLGIAGALLAVPVAAALQVVAGEVGRRVRPAD
ncbi:MAG: AI-2E family transporter [Armatimonadota bacterium]|nr:AI-2E family transporter [Armatimonadota bacterium]MDR7437733.1 AI-2E family transporter [Armatimonadota bacterium]MDR7471862.1 AI-2E family transporter [Armatimonadota bacterium]MDR7507262.1 AI-2E family transporter [Armatimonadota bacterium]MDR7509887.1 AI-2E family transporter [Armatimonadota bacterium]